MGTLKGHQRVTSAIVARWRDLRVGTAFDTWLRTAQTCSVADGIPTREEMVRHLWADAQKPDATAADKAKLCRVIAHLMGYNRGEDYADMEEKLRQLELMNPPKPKEPEVPWWDRPDQEQ